MTANAGNGLAAVFDTSKGQIRVALFADDAPLTVANFVNLAQRGFYDGLKFHRVIAGFMIQGDAPAAPAARGIPAAARMS